VYPLAAERRAALPEGPGVYRFLRRNGDVLYVGKATSLKKRVAGHFKARGPVTERGLELLTQVHDVSPIETPSLVEAALLESDEIKRLDPPYNVQLRAADRCAWFASGDLRHAMPAPDDAHRIGPLPSERALEPLAALIAIAEGAVPTRALSAAALAVPPVFAPERALFDDGFAIFRAEHLAERGDNRAQTTAERLAAAARALWLLRGRADAEPESDDADPNEWDLARVRRRLERSLVQTGVLARRARFLPLLAHAIVAFREREMSGARALVIAAGAIHDRCDLANVAEIAGIAHDAVARPRAPHDRKTCFDAAVYDRMRILLTELQRVRSEGGDVALRIGHHVFAGERVARLMRGI
jgi:DNA polymerase-3 subunit epsilon